MNGFIGAYSANKSDPSYTGQNWISPAHRQFIVEQAMVRPTSTLVFVDEHPDSINDGYFIETPSNPQWLDLPAAYHNGAGGVGFADGHVEIHSWVNSSTKVPVRMGFSSWGPIASNQRQDFLWITERMSVPHQTLSVTKDGGNVRASWSPYSSTYVLQSSASLSQPDWKTVQTAPVKASGLVTVQSSVEGEERYYRLMRP